MKDTLPFSIWGHEASVVNLDDNKGPGTHWTLIYNKPDDFKNVYYFDSFGVIPPKEVVKYLRTSNKKILYNSSQLQNLFSSMCGYFAVFMARELSKGKPYYNCLYELSQINTKDNDKFLQYYFHI